VFHVARSIQESELFFISGLREFKSFQNILGFDKNINAIPQCQTQLVAKLNDMLKGLDSSAGNELLDKVISQREIMQACKNQVCTPFSFSFSVIFRIELKTFLSKMTIIWVKRKKSTVVIYRHT
jgi:hypothetical protein